MCLLVVVDNYLCGHKVRTSHGIPPEEFIRECDDYINMIDCQIVANQEAVPWLCPNCHWEYVQKTFVPLWQQTTIAKCRVLQQAEMYPAEPEYRMAQTAAEHMASAFEAQQQAMIKSAIAYHKLRDKTLQCFLGYCFRIYMMEAHQAHRTWSMSYTRDPFNRVRSDFDTSRSDNSDSDDLSIDDFLGLGPPEVRSNSSITQEIATTQETTRPQSELATPSPPASTVSDDSDDSFSDLCGRGFRSEDLECIWCGNYGSSMGVTGDQRLCTECLEDGRRQVIAFLYEMLAASRGYVNEPLESRQRETFSNSPPQDRPLQPQAPSPANQPIHAPTPHPPATAPASRFFADRMRDLINLDLSPFVALNVLQQSSIDFAPSAAARQRHVNTVERGGQQSNGSSTLPVNIPSAQAARITLNRDPPAPGSGFPPYAQNLGGFDLGRPPQQQQRPSPRTQPEIPQIVQDLMEFSDNELPQQPRRRESPQRMQRRESPPQRRLLNHKRSEEDIETDGIE